MSTQLTSLPPGLAEQIKQAQALLAESSQAKSEGQYEFAISRAQDGIKLLTSLAQSHPDLATLVLSAQHGYSTLEVNESERVIRIGGETRKRDFTKKVELRR